MTWERAEDLAITLLGKGRSEGEVIKKLCEISDRYRGRCSDLNKYIDKLEDQLIQSKKDAGNIIQISVDMIQRYGFRKVVWYNGRPYHHHNGSLWTPTDPNIVKGSWPDETQYGNFKVWIELHEKDRDIVCKGTSIGFVNGMTCITLDPETQRKMFLNSGDEVTVTKVRKHFKG